MCSSPARTTALSRRLHKDAEAWGVPANGVDDGTAAAAATNTDAATATRSFTLLQPWARARAAS